MHLEVLIEHPSHGRIHVYSQSELDKHLALGWKVVLQAVPPIDNIIPIEKRQRGRPKK